MKGDFKKWLSDRVLSFISLIFAWSDLIMCTSYKVKEDNIYNKRPLYRQDNSTICELIDKIMLIIMIHKFTEADSAFFAS